jgi:hypothetical protein
MELAQNICTLAEQAFLECRAKTTCTLYVTPRLGWDACSIKFTPLERHILITAEGLEYKILHSDVQQFDDLLAFLIEAGVERLFHRFETDESYSTDLYWRALCKNSYEEEQTPCGFHIENGEGKECYALHCSEEDVVQQALRYARNFRWLSYQHNPTPASVISEQQQQQQEQQQQQSVH